MSRHTNILSNSAARSKWPFHLSSIMYPFFLFKAWLMPFHFLLETYLSISVHFRALTLVVHLDFSPVTPCISDHYHSPVWQNTSLSISLHIYIPQLFVISVEGKTSNVKSKWQNIDVSLVYILQILCAILKCNKIWHEQISIRAFTDMGEISGRSQTIHSKRKKCYRPNSLR